MRNTIATASAGLLCVAALGATTTARAQEEAWRPRTLEAPAHALELKAGTGYAQGWGQLSPTQSIPDAAGGGIGVTIDVDYRFAHSWSAGAQGEYDELGPRNDNASRAIAGNVGVTFHVRPDSSADPWVRLGSGYRLLASVDGDSVITHGFELAKATIGYDFRVDRQVAFAPVIGADVDLFGWQYLYAVHSLTTMPRAQVGSFVFAGLQARFDIGGFAHPESESATAAAAR